MVYNIVKSKLYIIFHEQREMYQGKNYIKSGLTFYELSDGS